MGPEFELDDLITQIRTEGKRERSLALYEGTRPTDLVNEPVDERLLRLLELEDVFDIDYDTYKLLLKERLVASSQGRKTLVRDEEILLQDEWKRIKGKVGRFKIKPKKISALGGALRGNISSQKLLDAGEDEETQKEVRTRKDPLITISNSLTSIIDILKEHNNFLKDTANKDRKDDERDARKKRESNLETPLKRMSAIATKIIKPFQGILSKILNFLKWLALGILFNKGIKWLLDPQNQGKAQKVGRFLKDWWPSLLGTLVLFTTPFGSFVRFMIGTAAKLTLRLGRYAIPLLKNFIKRNKVGAAIALTTAATLGLASSAPMISSDESPTRQFSDAGSSPGATFPAVGFKDGGSLRGFVSPSSKTRVSDVGSSSGPAVGLKDGGGFSGFVSPSSGTRVRGAGRDTQAFPIVNDKEILGTGVLTPGELVLTEEQQLEIERDTGVNPAAYALGAPKKVNINGFFGYSDGYSDGGVISPNARALLNTVRWAEGTLKSDGYNTWFGGRTDMDLTKMTIDEVVVEQKRRLESGEATYGKRTSAAVGAYQMLYPERFAGMAGLSGGDLFTAENQDKMAIAGYMKGQAGLSDEQINGSINRALIAQLAPVWASLPDMSGQSVHGQPVKSYEDLKSVYTQQLKTNTKSTTKSTLFDLLKNLIPGLNKPSPSSYSSIGEVNPNIPGLDRLISSNTQVIVLPPQTEKLAPTSSPQRTGGSLPEITVPSDSLTRNRVIATLGLGDIFGV